MSGKFLLFKQAEANLGALRWGNLGPKYINLDDPTADQNRSSDTFRHVREFYHMPQSLEFGAEFGA